MTDKRPAGRPKVLTRALRSELCDRIMDGQTVRDICADTHMPAERTVYRTLAAEGEEEFRQQYARAREIQLMRWEDDLLEIADDATNDWMEKRNAAGEVIGWSVNGEHIQRSRSRIDTRKWLMSKRAPKKYGDKVEQTVIGPGGRGHEAFAVINMTGKPEGLGDEGPQQTTYRYIVVRPEERDHGTEP